MRARLLIKKLAETRRQRLTLAVAVDLSLVAVKHIAHYTPGRGHIASGFVETLLDGICPRTCDDSAGGRPSCLESLSVRGGL